MKLSPRRSVAVAPPQLLCRWDLDKTYLKSEFDTLRQLWRTARERGADKVEVPGVPEVLKGLRAAADRREHAIALHFISASPPQIGRAIRDKLALDGVPYDGIVFKDQLAHIYRGKFRNLREHVGFKLAELMRGRLAFGAHVRELLFGDDWESDPLVYSLYADLVAGRLGTADLEMLLRRVGVDREALPEIAQLAADVAGRDGVERIFINLERRTPPAVFQLFGPRLVPTFNYFQTALVLAADGFLDGEDVVRVASALVDRSGFTPRRLENSLADLLRRRLLAADVGRAVARPLRGVGLLPAEPRSWRAWVARVRARFTRRPVPMAPVAGALDYDAILARMRPRAGVPAEASA
jgi:hypothetical protein